MERPKIAKQVIYLCGRSSLPFSLSLLEGEGEWSCIISAPAYSPVEAFTQVMETLIRHPERNSTNILRAEVVQEASSNQEREGYVCKRVLTRRILPRRPKLDWAMMQECRFWSNGQESVVIYTPRVERMPFYHPKVRAIAFRYLLSGSIQIDLIPLDDATRLDRVCLCLLTTIHTHSWGLTHSYVKRVHHDQLVPREAYQDLYLALKDRHASRLVRDWAEATDPKKHVFEDLGIAAFLILLWKGMDFDGTFVDVGCGNGVLVHILKMEGWKGWGFDGRSRKSWQVFQADLRELSLDVGRIEELRIENKSWLIGNHADELTPWLPVLANKTGAKGFINIPCCPFLLDGDKFTRTKFDFPREELATFAPGREDETLRQILVGQEAGTSRGMAYLKFLSYSHVRFGWVLEKEALRIPSTKNWALIGRTPSSDATTRIEEALAQAIPKWKVRVF